MIFSELLISQTIHAYEKVYVPPKTIKMVIRPLIPPKGIKRGKTVEESAGEEMEEDGSETKNALMTMKLIHWDTEDKEITKMLDFLI